MLNFYQNNIEVIVLVTISFVLFAMGYVAYISKYKMTYKIWTKSFFVGFLVFSMICAVFLVLPSILLDGIPNQIRTSLLYSAGGLGVICSYYCLSLFAGFYTFRGTSKTIELRNLLLESQRELKRKKVGYLKRIK